MRPIFRAAFVLACIVGLAGCGSSSPAEKTQAVEASRVSTSPEPAISSSVDPNDAACSDVQDLLTGQIRDTFNSWDAEANEFDKRVAKELRDGATKLYAVQRKADGAVSDAIATEAKGLTDLSIAIEQEDDSAVGDASNATNSALAAMKGVCDL